MSRKGYLRFSIQNESDPVAVSSSKSKTRPKKAGLRPSIRKLPQDPFIEDEDKEIARLEKLLGISGGGTSIIIHN